VRERAEEEADEVRSPFWPSGRSGAHRSLLAMTMVVGVEALTMACQRGGRRRRGCGQRAPWGRRRSSGTWPWVRSAALRCPWRGKWMASAWDPSVGHSWTTADGAGRRTRRQGSRWLDGATSTAASTGRARGHTGDVMALCCEGEEKISSTLRVRGDKADR
jgi:hypothetical protein